MWRPSAQLCETHLGLNAQLIHSIVCRFEAEVRVTVREFSSFLLASSPKHGILVHDLRRLYALWVPPEVDDGIALNKRRVRWSFQSDGCKACMLANVGIDVECLIQLRTTLVARRHRRRYAPQPLQWIESWIVWSCRANEIVAESDRKARALKKALRRARKDRRKRESTMASGIIAGAEAPPIVHEANDYHKQFDYERSIIDCYATSNIGSSPTLPTAGSPRRRSSSLSPSIHNEGPTKSAESQAEEYRALLGDHPRLEQRGRSPGTSETSWDYFFLIS